VERHRAADDRQQRIVAEDDGPADAAQMNGDRRGDFIGAEDDGEWRRSAGELGHRSGW
jgi:hypothetical protein